MRLSAEQVQQIKAVFSRSFKSIEHSVFLFGSRTHPEKKGGDIDLLLLTTIEGVDLFNNISLDILVALKKESQIGSRNIDLKVTTKENWGKDPFLQSIRTNCILL